VSKKIIIDSHSNIVSCESDCLCGTSSTSSNSNRTSSTSSNSNRTSSNNYSNNTGSHYSTGPARSTARAASESISGDDDQGHSHPPGP